MYAQREINYQMNPSQTDFQAVVIDLGGLAPNTQIRGDAQLIQQPVLKKLKQLVTKDLLAVKASPSKSKGACYPAGSGLTYFIDGTRGAGKSTFLQFTYDHLPTALVSSGCSLKPLLFLDPSRIERSELVLLHVLKQLKRLAKPSGSQGSDSDNKWETFNELIRDMAGGLHLFVSDNSQLKDLDAELFLEHGLERAADSQVLREKLHAAIDLVCSIRDVDALLIAVDDADTSAHSAIEVLECIRKYLDTPRLVLLVTGDMEMYSLLIQNHFVSTFAANTKDLNEDRRRQQLRMVDHLEEQYLLKIFPLPRRVQLQTLWALSQGDAPYTVLHSNQLPAAPIGELAKRLAMEGLRTKSVTDIRLFTEFLLKQPVRSILQVLSIFTSPEVNDAKTKIDACSQALRAMALSSLYQYGVDVDAIAASEQSALSEAVFDLSLRDGEPDTGAYLRPQPREAALRNSFVSLASDVARLCKHNFADSITYMLTGPGSVSVYFQVARKNKRSALDAKEDLALIKLFKQYLSVGRKEDALNWAWRTTAALVNTSRSDKVIRHGIVGLKKKIREKEKKVWSSVRTARDAIDEAVIKPSVSSYPAHAFCLIDVTSQGDIGQFASIYNTLGLMARLLKLDLNAPELESDVLKLLRPVATGLTISPPDWTGSDGAETDDEAVAQAKISRSATKEAAIVEPTNIKLQETASNIVDWLKYCSTLTPSITPSAAFLGKVWTRLYFSLSQASEGIRTSNLGPEIFATTMELFAWCVINAYLVEENDHHALEGFSTAEPWQLNRRNPATKTDIVAVKFDNFQKDDDQRLPLTFMVASCPLILGLMYADDSSTLKLLRAFSALKPDDSSYFAFAKKSTSDKDTWRLMANILVAQGKTPTKADDSVSEKSALADSISEL